MNYVPWLVTIILGLVILYLKYSHKKEIKQVSDIFWEKGVARGKSDGLAEGIKNGVKYILESILSKDLIKNIEVSQWEEFSLTSLKGRLNIKATRRC